MPSERDPSLYSLCGVWVDGDGRVHVAVETESASTGWSRLGHLPGLRARLCMEIWWG
jgi:hypothetical protein